MSPENFCYWLQGYCEIAASRTAPTSEEWEVIKQHLQLVFHKVTPPSTPTFGPVITPPPSFPPTTGTPPPFGFPYTVCGGGIVGEAGDFWKSLPLCGTDTTAFTASPAATSIGSFTGKVGGVIPKFDVSYKPAKATCGVDCRCIFPNCVCNPMDPDCANNGIVIHKGNVDDKPVGPPLKDDGQW